MPELTKGSQFEGRAASLIQTLRLYGLADYIFKDATALVKTTRGKALAMVDQDPKDFFDLVKKAVMDEGWEREAEKDHDELDVKKDATLLEFRHRLESIRAYMPAAIHKNESWGVSRFVRALEPGREVWHHSLMAELTSGHITWGKLLVMATNQDWHEKSGLT
ncbi:hypothetical protein GE09DRAFT_1050382 [Coniochaeta sp. 2T2.1]|nr:hypothetical protein GE09DRAFT_1050382 [Coniochaeta sp. 2T2.1]